MFSISTELRQWYVLFFVCYRRMPPSLAHRNSNNHCTSQFSLKSLINLPTFLVRIVVRFGGLQNVQNMLFIDCVHWHFVHKLVLASVEYIYIENSAGLFFIKN